MTRRKKKSIVAREGNAERGIGNEQKVLKNVVNEFESLSVDAAASAGRQTGGDPTLGKKGAVMEDQSTTCSSSSTSYEVGSSTSYEVGSSSSSTDIFSTVDGFLENEFKHKGRPKMKRVVASAGTVSTMLGKEYVRSTPKKSDYKMNGFPDQSWSKEEAEQFLCSMLGDNCELSLAVVRDVLCQCGYNVDKALDVLLELSAASKEQPSGRYKSTSDEDAKYLLEKSNRVADRTTAATSRSSFVEPQDNVWFSGDLFWNNSRSSESSPSHHSSEKRNSELELPQKLLESLFSLPTPEAAEQEPNKLKWRNIVKKMTSLGQGFKNGEREELQPIHAKGDEYHVLRESSQQHYDSMKSYYQKAATVFTSGDREYASYISEKGRVQNKMARAADEKASRDIFVARNKSIENVITIDLHGQHNKQAMKIFKLHLLFGAYVRSVKLFRVITGCGNHDVGKSKLKNSVVDLLKKEGISWSEENRGTLLIRIDGAKDFSFLDSSCDSDND